MKPESFGCVGKTIKVAGGHYVDLEFPAPDSIDIFTIASALSKTCRFGGHCPVFYSVAEHSLLAASLAHSDGVEAEGVLAVFLHDAAEAYIGDVVKPLKMMLPEYRVIEENMERVVGQRFRVSFDEHRATIDKYDMIMLKAEKQTFWPFDDHGWDGFSEVPDISVRFDFFPPGEAYLEFISFARVLMNSVQRW